MYRSIGHVRPNGLLKHSSICCEVSSLFGAHERHVHGVLVRGQHIPTHQPLLLTPHQCTQADAHDECFKTGDICQPQAQGNPRKHSSIVLLV